MRDRGVAGSLSVRPSQTVVAWADHHAPQTPSQPCVSLPFTAPALIQMRARRSRDGGLEMLLSNPSGGRGLYVSSWSALRRYTSPSLHDIMLAEKIESNAAREAPLTTASIQAFAIDVAAEGHAGRKLAQAARRAQSAEFSRQQRVQAHFVMGLARAILPIDNQAGLLDVAPAASLASTDWLRRASYHLAPHLVGSQPWQGADLAKTLAELAQLTAPLGSGPDDETGPVWRTRRLLAGAGTMRNGGAKLAEAIDLLLETTDIAFSRAYRARTDPSGLLAAWRADPAGTATMLQEPITLLDGCDRLCLLPNGSEEQARFAQTLLLEKEAATTMTGAGTTFGANPGSVASLCGAGRPGAPRLDTTALRLRELRLLDPDIDLDQILKVT